MARPGKPSPTILLYPFHGRRGSKRTGPPGRTLTIIAANCCPRRSSLPFVALNCRFGFQRPQDRPHRSTAWQGPQAPSTSKAALSSRRRSLFRRKRRPSPQAVQAARLYAFGEVPPRPRFNSALEGKFSRNHLLHGFPSYQRLGSGVSNRLAGKASQRRPFPAPRQRLKCDDSVTFRCGSVPSLSISPDPRYTSVSKASQASPADPPRPFPAGLPIASSSIRNLRSAVFSALRPVDRRPRERLRLPVAKVFQFRDFAWLVAPVGRRGRNVSRAPAAVGNGVAPSLCRVPFEVRGQHRGQPCRSAGESFARSAASFASGSPWSIPLPCCPGRRRRLRVPAGVGVSVFGFAGANPGANRRRRRRKCFAVISCVGASAGLQPGGCRFDPGRLHSEDPLTAVVGGSFLLTRQALAATASGFTVLPKVGNQVSPKGNRIALPVLFVGGVEQQKSRVGVKHQLPHGERSQLPLRSPVSTSVL